METFSAKDGKSEFVVNHINKEEIEIKFYNKHGLDSWTYLNKQKTVKLIEFLQQCVKEME